MRALTRGTARSRTDASLRFRTFGAVGITSLRKGQSVARGQQRRLPSANRTRRKIRTQPSSPTAARESAEDSAAPTYSACLGGRRLGLRWPYRRHEGRRGERCRCGHLGRRHPTVLRAASIELLVRERGPAGARYFLQWADERAQRMHDRVRRRDRYSHLLLPVSAPNRTPPDDRPGFVPLGPGLTRSGARLSSSS